LPVAVAVRPTGHAARVIAIKLVTAEVIKAVAVITVQPVAIVAVVAV
jgi:hypothetical protein